MQNLRTLQTTGLGLELFHLQSNTSFEVPPNYPVIRIGKPNEQIPIDINVFDLPNSDIVSRIHAEIHVENDTYFLIDTGSSNGTFLNGNKLDKQKRYQLNLGDTIELGHENKVTFIFQYKQQSNETAIVTNKTENIQAQVINNPSRIQAVDRKSKFIGLASMAFGMLFFTAHTRVGFGIGIPTILLLIGGAVILLQRRINPKWGWILVGLGTLLFLFSARLLASVNLLALILSVGLIFAGYKLFKTGKIFGYSLSSIKGLLKKQ